MGISVFCSGCQKQLNLDERFAGKKVKCKKCGGVLTVPATVSVPRAVPQRPVTAGAAKPASVPRPAARPAGHRPPPPPPPPPPKHDEFDDGPSLYDLESLPEPEVAPLVVPAQPKVYTPSKAAGIAKSVGGGTLGVAKKVLFFDIKKVLGAGFLILMVLGATLKIYRAYTKISGDDPLGAAIADAKAPKPTGTVSIPERPTMSPAGAGIVAGETRVTNRVGYQITVKVYLPAGNYAPKSLPAVMIAPAGSMGITGIPLTGEDTEEHLPYVRDGFAVVAYSLSGGFQGDPNANRKGLKQAAEQFHAAGGGVIDGQDALTYALARFPEIHPDYVVAAGHSSAASVALVLSYKEPRIKAVAAYSPGLNLTQRFGDDVSVLQRDLPGIRRWLDDYSADKLGTPRCPIMLFHARDDDNTPFSDSESYANKYPSQITLNAINSGGHSSAMLSTGVPAGIRFFRANVPGLPPKAAPQATATPTAQPVGRPDATAVERPRSGSGKEVPPLPVPGERVAIQSKGKTINYGGTTVEVATPEGVQMVGFSTVNNQARQTWGGSGQLWIVTITKEAGGDGSWSSTDIADPTRYRAVYDRIGDGVHIRIEAATRDKAPASIAALENARDGFRVLK